MHCAAAAGVPAEAITFDKQSDTYPGLPASMTPDPTLNTSSSEGTAAVPAAAVDRATVQGEDVAAERDSGTTAAVEVSTWLDGCRDVYSAVLLTVCW
jgi:hypothetical protein